MSVRPSVRNVSPTVLDENGSTYSYSFFSPYGSTIILVLSASISSRLQTPYRGFAPGLQWGLPSPEPPDWPVFTLGLSGGNPPPQKKNFRNLTKFRRDRRTRGTWLDDTDKNFSLDLPLLFKLHEIW